jgi:hypothetical protein
MNFYVRVAAKKKRPKRWFHVMELFTNIPYHPSAGVSAPDHDLPTPPYDHIPRSGACVGGLF